MFSFLDALLKLSKMIFLKNYSSITAWSLDTHIYSPQSHDLSSHWEYSIALTYNIFLRSGTTPWEICFFTTRVNDYQTICFFDNAVLLLDKLCLYPIPSFPWSPPSPPPIPLSFNTSPYSPLQFTLYCVCFVSVENISCSKINSKEYSILVLLQKTCLTTGQIFIVKLCMCWLFYSLSLFLCLWPWLCFCSYQFILIELNITFWISPFTDLTARIQLPEFKTICGYKTGKIFCIEIVALCLFLFLFLDLFAVQM